MKKKFLFLMALLAVSLLALAEMRVYVYQKDGTKVEYLAANVDSIGFVNLFTITFDANGGNGSMDVVKVKEGETITLPANTLTKGSSTFAGWNTQADGTGTAYADKASVSIVASQTLYAQWEAPKDTGIADGHEWVDLGLPSGLKWATCNVGANSPEKSGYYFAWGETESKSTYNWSTYKWSKGSAYSITKYCTDSDYGTVDNKTILDLSDDAAYVNWGSSWRMPTYAELMELIDNCTMTWTTQKAVKGYKLTSKTNGNSIFLPVAGSYYDSELSFPDSRGMYWSSLLSTKEQDGAAYLFIDYYGVNIHYYSNYRARYHGNSVRPVLREIYILGFDANGGSGSMSAVELDRNQSNNIPANTFTRHGYRFIGWNTAADGTGTAYADKASVTLVANQTLYAQWAERKYADGHEWVDLGLPSGTKWATCNVGADSPEDYGDYFAWGETTPKSTYNWSTYKWCKGSDDTMTKYCTSSSYGTVDNKTTLDLSDDAAYVNWSSSWRMPTDAELKELRNNCTWTWTTQNGVKGYKVTSQTNGDSIFLPAAGCSLDSDLPGVGSSGYYWSSSLNTDYSYYAYYLSFSSGSVHSGKISRYYGPSVRPVLAE